MPELPEVETVRRTLAPLVGRCITAVDVRERRLRRPIQPGFAAALAGRTITAVDRRAKYLLFGLSGDAVLLAHLGMSGSLVLHPRGAPRRAHDHVVFSLSGGLELSFHDPRRFGMLRVAAPDDLPELKELGPDPVAAPPSPEALAAMARGRRKPVKNFLMDQRTLGGIGNIYASEILFLAGVRPGRAAGRLRRADIARLLEATARVLREAIELGGSSISDYRNGRGEPGYFQLRLKVYNRAGEPCPSCSAPVKRTVHAGRSSYYCPRCQR